MLKESSNIFRREALAQINDRHEGDLLRIAPTWTSWTHHTLVLAFVAALLYGCLGRIHEYASGPAVVWMSGRTHVTATVPGTISTLEVQPGQTIRKGQVLARFSSTVETADLARIDHEFELQLARVLRDPSDSSARSVLTALRTQRDVAAARVDQLSIRAPNDGVIGDVRIRAGQHLQAGEVIVTLDQNGRQCSILAMLPAQYKPQLEPGMSVRFEVAGYRYAYQEMTVSSVSAQIIGPTEVRRFLGQEIQDTLKVEGPVILLEATPSAPAFVVDGQSFDFYHGMNGTMEARIRSESIVFAVFPALRTILGRNHG